MGGIAGDAGVLAGSVYHQFPSQDELLVSVHEGGIRRITLAQDEPWERKMNRSRPRTPDSQPLGESAEAGFRRPPKVLLTKIGLDGHDRGSRVVAAFLRDAGMEVVYTPPWQSLEAVVKLATEEDVDIIGVSSLATDHLLVPGLMRELSEAGLDDVAVVVGGIVPDADEKALLGAGVARVFHPGSSRQDIVATLARLSTQVRKRRGEI